MPDGTPGHRPPEGGHAGIEGRQAAARPGLVSTETSDAQGVTVFRHEARLKRMRRSVITSARLMEEDGQRGGFRWKTAMLTLTYRPDVEWDRGHVTGCLKAIRDYLRRRGHRFRYVWVLENTKAGKPHYHVLIWLPRGITLPKPDKRGWWPHGWTRIEWARNPVGYLAKYASKGDGGHAFPKGARLCGSGGLSLRARLERAWWMAPQWVKDRFSVEDRPVRAPGGGWMSRVTGEHLPSPWRLVRAGPGWLWAQFEQVPVAGNTGTSSHG